MKLLMFGMVCLAALSTALPNSNIQPRDFAFTNSSLAGVETAYAKLGSDVKLFKPTATDTIQSYLAIRQDARAVEDALHTAVSGATGSQRFSLTDSLSLLAARLAWEPALAVYLLIIMAAKPQFDSVLGLLSVRREVLAWLQTQAKLTADMDAAFQALLHPLVALSFTPIPVLEAALFDAAIAVYSLPAPAGHIELPADGSVTPDPSLLPPSVSSTLP